MASPRIVPTGVLGGQKGDKGDRGVVGPSGGPFPDLTGVTSGKVPQTTGGGGVEFVDLSASTDEALVSASGGDKTRQGRDVGLKAWAVGLADAAVTRVLIEGHSVVQGTGASDQPHTFARLTKAAIETASSGAAVTIDGHPGETSTQIRGYGVPGVISANPHQLVILMCLLNDYSAGIAPSTSAANLQNIVTTYTTGNAAPLSFLIVAEWQRSDVSSPAHPWAEYVAAAQSVADANPGKVTVLDLSQRMGAVSGNSLPLYADAAHPNDAGHQRIYELVRAELFATAPPSRLAQPVGTMIPAALAPVAASGWSGLTRDTDNMLLRYSDAAQNNSITYTFLGQAGHYTIGLDHRQQANAGKYDLYLDAVKQGAGGTWDGYAAANADAFSEVAGFAVTGDGLHTIQLVMATKNASSSSYAGVVRGIYVTRTGD